MKLVTLKNENNELKTKIENINNEINKIKKIKDFKEEFEKKINQLKASIKNYIKLIKLNYSDIMKKEEEGMIFSEIENKMDEKIKEYTKLYQATIDGGEPKIFHEMCDKNSNTLVLIESEGHRRFGGFTPIAWKSNAVMQKILK